ncbi:MAG: glycine cleavage system protein GcvH [Pseudomonadales bacterium]|nr:glycine cleavage system protein GcvH [Pseudomonadales bacterium]
MNQVPEDLKYNATHQWACLEEDGTVTVGITDYAQNSLGDVVYVELPDVGQALEQGQEAGVVESVKAASDIFSPISGEVFEINDNLEDEPELINDAPYGYGWFFKVRPSNLSELDSLLSADAYKAVCEA